MAFCWNLGRTVLGIDKSNERDSKKETAEERRQRLRNVLDPKPERPLSAQQHLEAAKRLLASLDVDDAEKSFIVSQLINEHVAIARQDSRLKASADAVMKRAGNTMTKAVLLKAWSSSLAQTQAKYTCRDAIESRLKAPSRANWTDGESARWANHPGYFLVDHTVDAQTVDAQNSFGAKLRATYQCQVVCLSEEACTAEKVYQIR